MDTSTSIRILIVDDHGMIRRGLAAYLENAPGLELVGEAQDGRQALDLCERVRPDVVLMDLVMPKLGGAAATRIIRQRWPQTQVIALTSFADKALVEEALQAGALSYLLKNVSGDDLVAAIQSAHSGRATLSPEAVHSLVQPAADHTAPGKDLTLRERDVLQLLVKGLTNAEIAQRLHISHSTAKGHVSNILSKLGASSRGEAIAIAIKHDLVQ